MRTRSLVGGVVLGVMIAALAPLPAALAAPPVFSKVFAPDEIGPGSESTLTFTIDNSAEASRADELAFSDTLPAGVAIATPANASTTCSPDAGGDGPTVTAPAGGTTISLADAAVGAGRTCVVTVDVTSSTPGTHTNTSGPLSSSAGTGGTATDDLTVATNRPGFLKDFSPDPIDRGERSTLTFVIDNSANGAAVTLASFTDTLPTGLVIADPANASTTCTNTSGAGLTAQPGTSTISFGAIALSVVAANSTCTIEVDVVATGSGTLINSTSNLETTVSANSRSAGKATASLTVTRSDLHLTKEFTDDPVPPGGTATLELTVDNFSRDFPATTVAFSDTLPAGVVVATPANVTNSCGGTVTAVSGSGVISLSGGTAPAQGSCVVTVDVTAAAAGVYTNETGTVSGTVDGEALTGNTAKDDLFVVPAPILTKEFTDDPVGPGDVATIHFELADTTTAGGSSGIAFTDNLTAVLSGLGVPSSTVTVGGTSHTAVVFQRWSTLEPVGLMGTVQYGDGVGGNTNGCSPFGAGTLTGLVVIVDDMGCTTTVKIQNIDAGGAVAGLVSTQNVVDLPENTPFAGGPAPSIPGYEVYKPAADAIKASAGATATIDTLDVAVPLPDFCGPGSAMDYELLAFDEYGLTMTGGNLATGATCMFDVTIPIPIGTASGTYPNVTSDVTATVAAMTVTGKSARDSLEVIAGPSLTKEFTDDPIAPGDSVTLEFTLTNDNIPMPPAATDFTATGIGFTDELSAVAAGLTLGSVDANDCGGSVTGIGTSMITFSGGGPLAPDTSCTIVVTVDSTAATPQGIHTNTTSDLTATVAGITVTELPGGDDLIVADLTLSKSFTDDPVFPGDTVTLEFTLDNASATDDATDISFTDDLLDTLDTPGGSLVVAPAETLPKSVCGGSLDDNAAGNLLVFGAGFPTPDLGEAPAGTTCTFTVLLEVPSDADAGAYPNTTSGFSASIDGSPTLALPNATDVLIVDERALTITKSFTDDPVEPGDTVNLRITLGNDTLSQPATGLAFTDDLEATLPGLVATGPFPVTDACVPVGGGTGTGTLAITGTQTLDFSGGTLAADDACIIDVTLTVPAGAAAANYPNTTSTLTGTVDGIPVVAAAATDVLKVLVPAPSSADLSISKTDSPDPVKAGDTLTYTITVDNAGPNDAANVVVTDVLPAGVTYVSDTDSCVEGPAGTLTCSLGIVPIVPGSVSFDVTVTVDSDTPAGTITNDVSVTSNTSDPDTSNNAASEDTTVEVEADLAISKTDSPDPVVAGETLTYTITVDNLGPSDATGVTVVDTLPAGVTYVSDTDSCAEGPTGTLTCSLGTIAAGGAASFDVEVTVASGTPAGDIANLASVSSAVPDPIAGNGATSETTTVATEADLAITKVDAADPVVAGETVTYTIEVTNFGPSDATGVTVVDTVPAGLMYLSDTDSCTPGVPGPGELTCDLGTIAAGDAASFDVTFSVAPSVVGDVDNVAAVSSDATDPDPSDNTATETTTVVAEADLAITKVDAADPVVAGETVTYTIEVTNLGPSDATGVTVVDTVPAGLMYLSDTDSCTPGVPGPGELTCDLGTIAAGDAASFDVTFSVAPSVVGDVDNVAAVSSDATDPDPSDNTATETTTVVAEADLAIAKVGDSPVVAGETVTYTLEVTNLGPSDATGVTLVDDVPAGLMFASATVPCTPGDPAPGFLTCDLGGIPAGSSSGPFDLTFTIDPATPPGTVTNEATVSSDAADPDPSDNTDTTDTVIEMEADLAITKVDTEDPVLAGESVTYRITVENLGASDATGVTVVDEVPAGLMFASATVPCTPGDPAPGFLTCDLGTLPAGFGTTFEVTFDVDPSAAAGDVTNEVTVSSDVADPDPSDNTAAETTTVAREADLAIEKADDPDPVTAGETLTYTIEVDNFGPSDATGVTVVDTLPAGVTYVSDTDACVEAPAGTLTCDLGGIPVFGSASFEITVTVDSGATGTLTNRATVSSDDTDPDTSDNSATETTAVEAEADLRIAKTDSPDPVRLGATITYVVTVTNDGPSDATGVVVTDKLPAGLVQARTSGCAEDPNGVPACSLGTIATGASKSYTITARVTGNTTRVLVNTASVSSATPDPDTSDNSATAFTTVSRPQQPEVGLFDPVTASWTQLLRNGSTRTFSYGNPGDYGIVGDWDGDGDRTPGVLRILDGDIAFFARNSNSSGPADFFFVAGSPGDIPVAGDWNGSGRESLALYRPSTATWFVFFDFADVVPDAIFTFGNPGDAPSAVDIDGDGDADPVAHRDMGALGGRVFVRRSLTAGIADVVFTYGNPGDRILFGDYDYDGDRTVGVYRPGDATFYLRNSNSSGVANLTLPLGLGRELPHAGPF